MQNDKINSEIMTSKHLIDHVTFEKLLKLQHDISEEYEVKVSLRKMLSMILTDECLSKLKHDLIARFNLNSELGMVNSKW